jgi:hypothetical protein
MTQGQAMQLAQALSERVQQIESGIGTRAEAVRKEAEQYVEDRLAVANYAESINQTLDGAYKQYPVLKALPEIEDILRYRVAQSQPESIEQTREAFQAAAKELAQSLGAVYAAQQQQQVVQRQALTTQGIEPPGGAVPQPPQESYRQADGKLDWKKMREAALLITQQQ